MSMTECDNVTVVTGLEERHMPPLTHERATAECHAIILKLGEHFAREIMAKTVHLQLEPDEMESLIQERIAEFKAASIQGDVCEHDIEVGSQALFAAIVKEGGRLARTMSWEVGSA
jgi:hypothetical protein